METNQTILVAPLDWGLGHATRCIPLIKQFLLEKHLVILAGQGSSLELLKQEFPGLPALNLKGYRVTYSESGFSFAKVFMQIPIFGLSIIAEHIRLRKWVKRMNITTVISDNRYGLWHPKTLNVIITHQLFIQLPSKLKWAEPVVHWVTKTFLNRFHECWVPDFEDLNSSLSGILSHSIKLPQNVKFIGPMSRFYKYEFPVQFTAPLFFPDVLVLISGPEPFRSAFQRTMEMRFSGTQSNVLMVCGKPLERNRTIESKSGFLQVVPHVSTPELYYYLKNTPLIITLSGYSTLMDLYALERTAELIPSPGQTEQEYLAKWWRIRQNRLMSN
jgi:hypothetical protein